MIIKNFSAVCASFALLTLPMAGFAADATITVDIDHPTHHVSPRFYGLMTEEINHSYEGGLYAEQIQNRNLTDNQSKPVHWSASSGAAIELSNDVPSGTALSASLKCDASTTLAGVNNDGYWGVTYYPGAKYHLSFWAKSDTPGVELSARIVSSNATDGSSLALASPVTISDHWQKYSVVVNATSTAVASTTNAFQILADQKCSFWLANVSLMPPTFNNRPNGNRSDLMTLLDGLHPSFLRLPGGNYLEGNTLADYFPWKKTIGDIDQRPGHRGPWGYGSNDGMGLLEYLEWCEDLHMQPVLAVYAGYALNGTHIAPGPDLQPFVQDALDEIEYVSGPVSSKWGAERAKDGHPKPFPLTYVEVGNEDAFDPAHTYDDRYAQFYDAIKAKYPKLQIIATTPVKSRTPDVVDDHYYRSAAGNERDSHHYDSISRTGPKIFVGEWASTEGKPTPTMQAALGDAAWLTGLERNSDLVVMESYAPLLVRVDPGGGEWATNLIGYDGLHSFGSPSYYVQSVFAQNTGSAELPVEIQQPVVKHAAPPPPSGAIGLGTWDTQSQYRNITVTNNGKTLYQSNLANSDSEWTFERGSWTLTDGALTQTSNARSAMAYCGDPNWTDYTLKLQARKLSGIEGFLIVVHRKSNEDFVQYNFGGWGNTRTTIQRFYKGGDSQEIAPSLSQTVNANQWYDIEIDVKGSNIACFIDGQPSTSVDDKPFAENDAIFSSASRSADGKKVYIKVVNVSENPVTCDLNLMGAQALGDTGLITEITGDPTDQNTVDQPEKVHPVMSALHLTKAHGVTHTLPAHSVSVFTLNTQR